MKKSILLVFALLLMTSLFWGCEDEKTVTNTEYVPVNIHDTVLIVGLEIHNFVKKDTILDTISGDTSFTTNTSELDYGTILYSAGTYNNFIQKVSVDRQHVRKALISLDMTIYDTLDEDAASDTIINDTDTLFYDSVYSYDSTKTAIIGNDAFSDTVQLTLNDTVITSNNSYLMTVNGTSAGYIGLGYLIYSNSEKASITGLKNLTAGSIVFSENSDLYLLEPTRLIKYNDNIFKDSIHFDTTINDSTDTTYIESLTIDTVLSVYQFSVTSKMNSVSIGNGNIFISDSNSDSIYVFNISQRDIINGFGTPISVSTNTGVGSNIDLVTLGSQCIVNSTGTNNLSKILKLDSNIVSEITLSQTGADQEIASLNDSLLIVLTPRQGDLTRGTIEVIDLSGATDTSLGIISSARYVPAGISEMNFVYSTNNGYILDKDAGTLYQISFTTSDLNKEDDLDFLTEIVSNVSSYTFDNSNIFVSTKTGELLVYSHSDFSNPIKMAKISGGAATSLSILKK